MRNGWASLHYLKTKCFQQVLGCACPVLLWLVNAAAFAQEGIVVQGAKVNRYFPAPHGTNLQFALTGAKAQPLAGGLILFTEAKLRTFLENGQPEMIVEAAQCTYNGTNESIYSPGPLRLAAADSKFSLEGEGFLWRQTNSVLFVSNRVHTLIHPDLLQPQTNSLSRTNQEAAKGIEVFSDHLDYSGDTGVGNYRGGARAISPDMAMSCETLQFLLPMKQRQVQRLTGEGNVELDSGDIHAAGQQVVYSLETGIAKVSGQPTWRAAARSGSGDELFIDQTNRIFRAEGHALLTMPRESLGTNGFLPTDSTPNTNAVPSTNQVVQIQCQTYELRTNLAVFRNDVLVSELADNQPQGTMTCAKLTAIFTGTNQMQSITAEDRVVIEQPPKRFVAAKAVYSGTNGLLELTGDPLWQDGPRQGSGQRLILLVPKNELTASGQAWVRLPAQELGQLNTPAARTPAGPATATNQFAEIFAPEYRFRPDFAEFLGGVRIQHPQVRMTCQSATLTSSGAGESRSQLLTAQDSVVFDLTDEKGQKIYGTGQKAVYTYAVTTAGTNDTIELTGNPMLVTTNGSTFHNRVIILDRASGKLVAPGRYSIRGAPEPVQSTNTLHSPKTKSRKKK